MRYALIAALNNENKEPLLTTNKKYEKAFTLHD